MRIPVHLVASLCVACSAGGPAELPSLNLAPDGLTVSGLSSGGFMAVQYHVAYSAEVRGAGIVAAGPWFCAQGSVPIALSACMKAREAAPDVPALLAAAREAAGRGAIDPVANLAQDNVWVFHGTRDDRVRRPVSDALVAFYREFVPAGRLVYRTDVAAAHGFPTLDEGIGCDTPGAPWLNDCDFDGAGELLRHLYGELEPSVRASDSRLQAFDQHRYAHPGALSSLEEIAYAYVPKRCAEGVQCRVHVAFHGCGQGTSFVGRAFINNAGYNGWAEANDIVVLYPQAARSLSAPLNPLGCWDWWGYTGPDYAHRDGPQLVSVRRMLRALGYR